MRFLLITLVLLTLSIRQVKAQEELMLVSDVWAPFTNHSGEKAISIDIVTEALSRSDIKAITYINGFKEVVAGIKEGIYHGSPALWRNEEREEFLIFSIPYLHNKLVLVGKKGSDVSASHLSRLKGHSVAIVSNYAYEEVSDSITNGIEIIRGKSDQDNLKKLLNGETDYILVDHLLVEYLITYQPEEVAKYLEIGTETIMKRSLHFALSKEVKDARLIVEAFNKNIIKMMADGSYNRILQLNWIKTDINGDGKMELVLSGNKAGGKAPNSGYDLVASTQKNTSDGNSYYINGKLYKSWEEVPAEFKVDNDSPASDSLKVFDFSD